MAVSEDSFSTLVTNVTVDGQQNFIFNGGYGGDSRGSLKPFSASSCVVLKKSRA